jgi:hypothetical protein
MAVNAEVPHEGELGEVGLGSVLLRIVGGLRTMLSISRLGIFAIEDEPLKRNEGTGEGLNSSMRSVSGTGSMAALMFRHKTCAR